MNGAVRYGAGVDGPGYGVHGRRMPGSRHCWWLRPASDRPHEARPPPVWAGACASSAEIGDLQDSDAFEGFGDEQYNDEVVEDQLPGPRLPGD